MTTAVVVGCRRETGHSRESEWIGWLFVRRPLLTGGVPSARLVTRRPCSGRRILEGTAVSASTSRTSTPTGSCCSNSTCANSSCLLGVVRTQLTLRNRQLNFNNSQLTGQTREAFVGDGRLAQVEHLQFVEVFANQLKAGIAKL